MPSLWPLAFGIAALLPLARPGGSPCLCAAASGWAWTRGRGYDRLAPRGLPRPHRGRRGGGAGGGRGGLGGGLGTTRRSPWAFAAASGSKGSGLRSGSDADLWTGLRKCAARAPQSGPGGACSHFRFRSVASFGCFPSSRRLISPARCPRPSWAPGRQGCRRAALRASACAPERASVSAARGSPRAP